VLKDYWHPGNVFSFNAWGDQGGTKKLYNRPSWNNEKFEIWDPDYLKRGLNDNNIDICINNAII
jgi:hypothetical protein